MKRLPRLLTAAGLLLVLLSSGLVLNASRAFGQERGEAPVRGTIRVEHGADLEALAQITPDEAKAAARSHVAGAAAEEAELENEDGFLVYAVDLSKGGEEMEVLVDAGDGSVLRTETEEAENDDEVEDDEGREAGEGEGKRAMRADLPQAVEDAFHEKYPQAEIVGTDVEHESGHRFYEVESRDGGMSRDLLYRADGRVYEIEEQVKADALPEAVRRALDKRGRIVKVERVTREGAIEYEAAVREGGQTREVVLNADGRVIEGSGEED